MDDLVFMDAEIRPNRSLSRRGFVVLITVLTVLNCASAAVFLSMGAVFVPMFLGLDLVAVVVAFLVSFAAAKQIERVRVTDRQVQVFQETPTWKKLMWESPTAFTRVTLLTEDDHAIDLRLALSGKEAPVARALSPAERAEFAKALEGAIYSARRARF
ncbi:MAG: DUF2244 domain-containing protein [Phenylobacterium sp.]|uniref:DUF2244 domain-containing protein n=1 Tax=Phenylobacterium ferrooxidans TaxID=2982689 RepID=A0ABW6CP51_9CAUL|nr:DUF2244 domain-containing protein [Phenylobacterium sp.]MDO8913227.1 DUF2244 domain-containing protein [Phenylobacterium sp.]MDO9246422.1 DUF2244 domain-containing protein [Phenylobacterium sp.]MDP3100071.1 DUF2244 domain-containing protein [Phenylobacterium sp.]MDP3867377.1 DUF2244 domain-containing protein [Phenylobacterium sp.]HQT51888.1 DUF2244 domain-containing protein [Phenylobacterium sp.]